MNIAIGTTNPTKITAAREALQQYPLLSPATLIEKKTSSGVDDQPKTLAQTIKGAKNRAKQAFDNCTLSIGLESGLMKVPAARTGYLDLCVCAIYDGKHYALGFSPGLEYPPSVIKLIFKGLDSTQAFNTIGLTKNPKVGMAEGTYGILTKGRLNRKEYTKLAIMMALVQIEFPQLYNTH